ncbi:hypothetical protein OAT97_00140 [Gammaproteobacteria bacterium]|nr:hypothetical protein [Gammaproteobacteria bacterium]
MDKLNKNIFGINQKFGAGNNGRYGNGDHAQDKNYKTESKPVIGVIIKNEDNSIVIPEHAE